jgi:hypothetical protein
MHGEPQWLQCATGKVTTVVEQTLSSFSQQWRLSVLASSHDVNCADAFQLATTDFEGTI